MGDCGSYLAVPFFVSFQVLCVFVSLNLVIAVIIESFGGINKQEMSSLTPVHFVFLPFSSFSLHVCC